MLRANSTDPSWVQYKTDAINRPLAFDLGHSGDPIFGQVRNRGKRCNIVTPAASTAAAVAGVGLKVPDAGNNLRLGSWPSCRRRRGCPSAGHRPGCCSERSICHHAAADLPPTTRRRSAIFVRMAASHRTCRAHDRPESRASTGQSYRSIMGAMQNRCVG